MPAALGRPAIDMTGRELFDGSIRFLRRAGMFGGRYWVVLFTACGHEQTENASDLRCRAKSGRGAPPCKACAQLGIVGLRPNFVSYLDRVIGAVTVVRRRSGLDVDDDQIWWCRCACGGEFAASSQALKDADPETYACKACRKLHRIAKARASMRGKTRAPKGPPRWCAACGSLPWRRPATGCRICGEPYEAEKLPTLEDVLARPAPDRRTPL